MATDFLFPALYQNNSDRFVIIAHRGASAYYPENTMAAFQGAIEMKAEMIELDVMLSKDGIPVVFHDARLNAHTDGKGLLEDCTLADLQQLDAGSWFDSRFSGEKIPTLEQVLSYASGTIALNIEIKPEAVTDHLKGGVEEKALELVKKYHMEEHVLFSSFDYRAIAHVKALDADMPAALLYNFRQSGKKAPRQLIAEYKADAFNCSYYQLNHKRLAHLKKHRIPTFIYTVDKKKQMEKLLNKGVSGIFTNKPDVLNALLQEKSFRRPFAAR